MTSFIEAIDQMKDLLVISKKLDEIKAALAKERKPGTYAVHYKGETWVIIVQRSGGKGDKIQVSIKQAQTVDGE
jgi:membrane protein implicated in regulation of membrane protease activity